MWKEGGLTAAGARQMLRTSGPSGSHLSLLGPGSQPFPTPNTLSLQATNRPAYFSLRWPVLCLPPLTS